MDISIDKIDTVVARTKVSYKEAKQALERTSGDVIEAIILIEESLEDEEILSKKGEAILDKVKELVKEGNVTKVIVKRNNKVILNIPVTLAAIGAVLYVKLALLGLGLAVISNSTIEIIKENGEVIKLNKNNIDSYNDTEINDDDYINL